jgi:hypothetical protein
MELAWRLFRRCPDRDRFKVCTGGITSNQRDDQPMSFAEMAAAQMIRLGVPKAGILVATCITKVNSPFIKIGAIAWSPAGFWGEAWWQSSDRSRELLKETPDIGMKFCSIPAVIPILLTDDNSCKRPDYF